jgi:hypothetical protein
MEDTFPLTFSGNILIVDRLIEMSLMHWVSRRQQNVGKMSLPCPSIVYIRKVTTSRCIHSKYVSNQAGTKVMAPIFEVTTRPTSLGLFFPNENRSALMEITSGHPAISGSTRWRSGARKSVDHGP